MNSLRFLSLLLLVVAAAVPSQAAPNPNHEYIILVGGPSLMMWEKYKAQPHDHWWANFVRAGRIRTEQLRERFGPDAKITWLVYKKGYIERGEQEKRNLIEFIESVRDKYNLNLVWFDKGNEVINYLNHGQPRDQVKIAFFEFFGHSNKACFMFDYSSGLDSASKSWLHESELSKINGRAFARNATVRSWGCHTGESFSKKWRSAVGNRMWGVIGKTQYQTHELPYISTPGGKWTD
ncbi:MAG TPA: hypothetical protein VG095_06760 [Chthoniobacterales bacterium]|nr:hypothetical protein [Chthoniobacterales bacterium]